MASVVTIYELLTEMQTWVEVSPSLLDKAKRSGVNSRINGRFRRLVGNWMNGSYDECPNMVVEEIETMLN